jgi:hypothetical protein
MDTWYQTTIIIIYFTENYYSIYFLKIELMTITQKCAHLGRRCRPGNRGREARANLLGDGGEELREGKGVIHDKEKGGGVRAAVETLA